MNQTTEKEKPKRWKLVLLGLLMILLAGMTVANIQRGLTSQIYLYGEEHSQQRILDEELEIWGGYYARGMRDLFVEFPYFDAQFLNLWMKADDDELLNLQFQDWQGTQGGTEVMKNFLKQIKKRYPETVFHGTDVGHTWKSTGARYLAYLEANGQNDTAEYQRALENIEQGKTYYATRQTDSDAADAYRENKMVENFERSYQELEAERRADIMGIYGAAHIASSYSRPDYMAGQLSETYGGRVHTEDLSMLTEPLATETITVNGKRYTASYFGEEDISKISGYKTRKFWRLENAYQDFKDLPTTGEVMGCNNYPMAVETGQVFMVELLNRAGTTETRYYRADGNQLEGQPVTEWVEVD